MYMERLILKKLLNWKNSPYRKPLILKGVRQVGKTWILKEFGKRYYENTAYKKYKSDHNIMRTWRSFSHIVMKNLEQITLIIENDLDFAWPDACRLCVFYTVCAVNAQLAEL